MNNTYIKNTGTTKTIMHLNNKKSVEQINWDAAYDGNKARVSIDTRTNGRRRHYNFMLDNEDLANLLNVPSVNKPLEDRLRDDFERPYYLEYQRPTRSNVLPFEYESLDSLSLQLEPQIMLEPEILLEPKSNKKSKIDTSSFSGILSPSSGEEFIVPITINKKTTPANSSMRKKTHKTHRVYRRHKSNSSKSRPTSSRVKSKSKSRTRSKSTLLSLL